MLNFSNVNNSNEVKHKDFIEAMEVVGKNGYVCGVITSIGKNEVVAVLDAKIQFNFPKGKQDYLNNKKTFRQFREEINNWISNKNSTKYVDIYFFDEIIRF